MIRYTVVWSTPALNQLAQIWIDAGDREAVNFSAAAIDRELATNPESKGESVHEGLRAFQASPLYVLYTVSEPDRLVRVVRVRLHEPERPGPRTNGAATP
jgi:plasmid stabilization system protein ParE